MHWSGEGRLPNDQAKDNSGGWVENQLKGGRGHKGQGTRLHRSYSVEATLDKGVWLEGKGRIPLRGRWAC